ncbi:MAG: division initiation protein [Mycobacterium sp.]|nr:division initiation protein [Mycobacterium sp.]
MSTDPRPDGTPDAPAGPDAAGDPDPAPVETAPVETAPVETAPADPAPGTRRQAPGRARRAGVWIGLLTALLGFALAVQVKSTESMALPTARQEDLVRILDDLNAREERLRRDIADLERTRSELTSGAVGSEAALQEARRRTQQLRLLAGTIPATGPGVVITLTEGKEKLPADLVLDAVEELRGAGAEALQITGREGGSVRIGTATYFLDSGDGILVDGKSLHGPYTIVAIGDKATLAAALNIPGGVVNTVEQAAAAASIDQRDRVVVSTLRQAATPEYARPAS